MTDDEILAALFRRFLGSEYWDTEGPAVMGATGRRRLCLDGTIYDLTEEELGAIDRAFPRDES